MPEPPVTEASYLPPSHRARSELQHLLLPYPQSELLSGPKPGLLYQKREKEEQSCNFRARKHKNQNVKATPLG